MVIDPLSTPKVVPQMQDVGRSAQADAAQQAAHTPPADTAELAAGPDVSTMRAIGGELRSASIDLTQRTSQMEILERAYKFTADLGQAPKEEAPVHLARAYRTMRDALGEIAREGGPMMRPDGAVAGMLASGNPEEARAKAAAAADELRARLEEVRGGADEARTRLGKAQVAFENLEASTVTPQSLQGATAPKPAPETARGEDTGRRMEIPQAGDLAAAVRGIDINRSAASQFLDRETPVKA